VWVGAWPGDPKWVGANPGHRNERFRSHRQGMIGPDEKSKLQNVMTGLRPVITWGSTRGDGEGA
jgi:hypothetical protein